MTVSIAPYPRFKAFAPGTGNPLSGGNLWTLQPGTSGFGYLKASYADAGGLVVNTNPVVLDPSGEADVWLSGYTKLVLHDAAGNLVWSRDNVSSSPAAGAGVGQWISQALLLTYVSGSQFSTPGDQTGMRVQAIVSAGTIYGTITASASSGSPLATTVTVSWDEGALDQGLSAVSTGILTPLHGSLPAPPVYISNYASLTSAVAAIGAAPMSILVNVPTAVTASTVVPANISIHVAEGGLITDAGGGLTINGPFSASGRAFSGFSGSQVVWGPNAVTEVPAAWFYSGSDAWDTAIQAANDSIVASNLPLTVTLPASCALASGVSIDLSYASLRGDNGVIDATAITTGAAITATGSVNPPYTQGMNRLEGFRLYGGSAAGTIGILFETLNGSGQGPSHGSMLRVQVDHFDVGIEFYSNAYNISCFQTSVTYCNTHVKIPSGGTDYASEIRFFGGEFYGGANWYLDAEGGNGQDIYFIGASFLYMNGSSTTARLFNLDGYKLHLLGCHVETASLAPLDAAIGVFGNNGVFEMRGGYLSVGPMSAGGPQYAALVNINNQGSNRCGVILDSLYMNVSVSGGRLIGNIGNGGSFVHAARLDPDNPGSLLPLISDYTDVTVDGGFENPSYVLDNIYVVADGGGITGRLASSTVTASLSASDHHSGTQCLSIAKSSGASAAGAVAMAFPIRGGERPFFELWAKGAQPFNIYLHWYCLLTQGVMPGQTVFSNVRDVQICNAIVSAPAWAAVNAGTFPLGGGYYGTLPQAPDWATHFAIVVDLYPVNAGTVLIDDVKVNIVK